MTTINKYLVFFLLAFFILIFTTIYWFNKMYQLPGFEDAQRLTKTDVTDAKVGSLRGFEGIVVKKPYETDQDILIFEVANKDLSVGVTLFPDMGVLDQSFELGDRVQITGLVDRYKQKIQLQPLSKESIRVIETGTKDLWSLYPVVKLNEINEYQGQTVIIDPVYLDNVKVITSNKKQHILFQARNSNKDLSGIFYHGNWTNADLSIMKSREPLKLFVDVDTYEGKLSLVVQAVVRSDKKMDISPSEIRGAVSSQTEQVIDKNISLSELSKHIGQTIKIGPVKAKDVEFYKSKAGKKHIRLKLLQDITSVNAIMYDGVWNEDTYRMLSSAKEIFIEAEISNFNKELSIVINSVHIGGVQ